MRLLCMLAACAMVCAAQPDQDRYFREAGVCARCHVISVVEWGMSGHTKAGTTCTGCHGESRGHVIDERNNVKPDRIPRGAAAAGLCATCHASGCPKSKKNAECESCHHFHALVDPNKPAQVRDDRLAALDKTWQEARQDLENADRLRKQERWQEARDAYRAALQKTPGNAAAVAGLKVCERRLKPDSAGFEAAGAGVDESTGLPREVRVAGLGLAMVLVPGGDADIGSGKFPGAVPIHSLRLAPFYLGKFEVTRKQWAEVMGTTPGADETLPVTGISWNDAQEFLARLNRRVPGSGFRLPAEVEWEFAAKGSAAPAPAAGPQPVGRGKPNRFGVYDMFGNVWEWCSTAYRAYPYEAGDGRESSDPQPMRVLRGGSFADTAAYFDASFRHAERPDRRLRWNGLRLARTVAD